jgi:uncharacterized membrane protein YedE/YeeE
MKGGAPRASLAFAEWPWYVAGPLIGLFVPALLLVGNKVFGISSNLSHLCAAVAPGKLEFFHHDWRKVGFWNLVFVAGVLIGGLLAFHGEPPQTFAISTETRAALARLGIHDFSGVAPHELFTWHALLTLRGFVLVVVGGFLVGFGTAYAGGCTSGHAISGLANFELPSLIAVFGFFAGGLAATYFILPFVLAGYDRGHNFRIRRMRSGQFRTASSEARISGRLPFAGHRLWICFEPV